MNLSLMLTFNFDFFKVCISSRNRQLRAYRLLIPTSENVGCLIEQFKYHE
jgi:hypothetical protein